MNIYDDGIGEVTLIQSMGEDNTPALAARVSFAKMATQSEMNQRDKTLINYLAVNRHTSPFEHISATFLITCPLFIAHITRSADDTPLRILSFTFLEVYANKPRRIYNALSLSISRGLRSLRS
jgi:hypothetical protein